MKKKVIFVLFTVLVLSLLFVACDKENEPPATEEPTAEVTATPSPVPTPTPTLKPTVQPIAEEKKGIPQNDAAVLFEDNFDEDNLADKFFTEKGNFMEIEDGKLALRQDWTAFAPDVTYSLGIDHSQYEMTITYEAFEKSDGLPWTALFVGCRGPMDRLQIATENGVFWVAFNGTNEAHVYPGGGGTYPNGTDWNLRYFPIELPEDFVQKPHKITVVDCGDVICHYMNTAEEEYYLIVKVLFEGDELVCYGHDGTEIWRETSTIADEGTFLFFNHYGRTLIDDIVVKGLS